MRLRAPARSWNLRHPDVGGAGNGGSESDGPGLKAGQIPAAGPVCLAVRERKRGALDKLIAAHALALDIVLVTTSEADFGGNTGLKLENWVNLSWSV